MHPHWQNERHGVNGLLGQWLGFFLIERIQFVKTGDTISNKERIISGVLQGSILGPIMFIILILDISKGSDAASYIYVDDSNVTRNISD